MAAIYMVYTHDHIRGGHFHRGCRNKIKIIGLYARDV